MQWQVARWGKTPCPRQGHSPAQPSGSGSGTHWQYHQQYYHYRLQYAHPPESSYISFISGAATSLLYCRSPSLAATPLL